MNKTQIIDIILDILDKHNHQIYSSEFDYGALIAYLFEEKELILTWPMFEKLVHIKELKNENKDYAAELEELADEFLHNKTIIQQRQNAINKFRDIYGPLIQYISKYDYYFSGIVDIILRKNFKEALIFPNGTAVTTLTDKLYIWDLKHNVYHPLRELLYLNRHLFMMAHPKGYLLIIYSNYINVYNATTGDGKYEIYYDNDNGFNENLIAFLPNGNICIIANSEGILNIYDYETGDLISENEIETATFIFPISNDKVILSYPFTGIRMFNLITKQYEFTLEGQNHLTNPSLYGNYLMDYSTLGLYIWDVKTGKLLFEFNYWEISTAIFISFEEIAVSLTDGQIRILNFKNSSEKIIEIGNERIYATTLCLLPDNTIMAGLNDGTSYIIDLTNPKYYGEKRYIENKVEITDSYIKEIQVLPDNRVATINGSNTIVVWK